MSTVHGLWLMVAALACAPALADLRSAESAYKAGDFAKAFEDFRKLAEIGQPTAQFDLAIMYERGEGARQSEIYAYAWASLAADNGLERAKSLLDELRPRLAPGSEKIAADIRNEFGNAELDSRLNPKIVEDAAQEDKARCHILKARLASYPPEAALMGAQGALYTEFTVMPDGHARLPRIIYAVPTGLFERAARETLLHSEFGVAPAGSPPAQCTLFFNFQMGAGADQYPKLESLVRETRSRADAGDPYQQMLYGMLLVGLPQLHQPRSHALPWFLKAAQGGVAAAQYQVGYSLLKGWGCDCEVNKGLDWLRRAAQDGQADAEVTLAMYSLVGDPEEQHSNQARLWLEQAAQTGNHDGKLYLAALLATSPLASGGDPGRAMQLLDEVFRDVKDDPTAFEIRAAAQASGGDFKRAAGSEAEAIKLAHRLNWDVSPLNQRLATYAAGQPWKGNLLVY